ncbi:MAG: hypothetical protein R3185_06280 [Candidatus Thermoplasmatota archaeon]|nr:hypothetical protein [Candidatus Thermoplasmatota archaeon]
MMANQETTQQDEEEQTFNAREPAWRLFAAEFNDARFETSEGGERAPTYVVTPLGARLNRVLIVGVLTSNEPVGEDGSVRRAQVTDPSGVFHIYAGQYQPEALQALQELEPPAIVAVVGKARTYSPEEGVVYTSIRPEAIHPVSSEERDAWIVETAEHTLERVEAVAHARALAEPTEQALLDLGIRPRLTKGILDALSEYSDTDLGGYLDLVGDALGYVMPAPPEPRMVDTPASTAEASAQASEPAAPTTEPSAPQANKVEVPDPAPEAEPGEAPIDAENIVFDLVEALDDGDGALWDEIVSQSNEKGLSEEDVEEAMNLLMDRGRVFEPVLGRMKAT